MRIARVFPRKTKASPVDEYTFFDRPGMFLPPIDEVHISVAFSYDLPKAESLARQWKEVAPVKIGGPALNEPGGDFVPGMYLKKGYVITSRGCPNRCWFCNVWRREGAEIRELPITDGNNVLDDNLLACSERHVRDVFAMLKRQKLGRVMFTGGMEAALLKDWHIELLRGVNPDKIFFAYDTPNDLEPLVAAGEKLRDAGFNLNKHFTLRAYVLIGYPGDTIDKAEARLAQTIKAGFMPMAMLFRDEVGKTDKAWEQFQRFWARPATINTRFWGIRGDDK